MNPEFLNGVPEVTLEDPASLVHVKKIVYLIEQQNAWKGRTNPESRVYFQHDINTAADEALPILEQAAKANPTLDEIQNYLAGKADGQIRELVFDEIRKARKRREQKNKIPSPRKDSAP